MTKQEFENAEQKLRDSYVCDSDYYPRLVDLDSEYIASLEAENEGLRTRIEELEESLHGVERQKEEIEGIMNTLNRAIKELPSYVVDNCMTIEDMTSEMLDEYLSPFFT